MIATSNTEGFDQASKTTRSTAFHFDVRHVPNLKTELVDHVEEFRRAISSAGFKAPRKIQDDGVLHRFSTDEKKDKSGWYVLHGDGVPAGEFGCWRQGLTHKWCAKSEIHMSAAEKLAHQNRIFESIRTRHEEVAIARMKAAGIAKVRWESSIVPEKNEYLAAKGVGAYGVRTNGSVLLVPMLDTSGKLHSLQLIDRNGFKRFLTGGLKKGCFHAIGHSEELLIVCEGYATGASIFEATGQAVVVAFDAGNLEPVARSIRATNAHLKIVIAADDDWKTSTGNVGKIRAIAAAKAVGGTVICPVFTGSREDKHSDFNDLAVSEGLQAVRNCFEMVDPPPSATELAGFRILSMPDGLQVTEYVIDGFLPNGLTVIAGEPGIGKTTNLVPMAASAAHLTPADWGVHPKRRRTVVWLSEHPEQVFDTIEALMRLEGAATRDEFAKWFKVIATKRSSPEQLAALIESANSEFSYSNERGVVVCPLIVWDTAAATIDLESENSNTDISKAIALAKEALLGGALWVITHTPKSQKNATDERAMSVRGGSAYEGDANCTAYLFADADGCRVMALGKIRFKAEFSEIHFDTTEYSEIIIDDFDGLTIEKTVVAGVPSKGSRQKRQDDKKVAYQKAIRDSILATAISAAKLGILCSQNDLLGRLAFRIHRNNFGSLVRRMIAEGDLNEIEIPKDLRKELKLNNSKKNAIVPSSVDPLELFSIARSNNQNLGASSTTAVDSVLFKGADI